MRRKTQNFKSEILFIGIGNEYRTDDRVGLIVAQKLRETRILNTETAELMRNGTSLIDRWKDARTVFLFDAVFSGVEPGTVHRFDAITQAIPINFFRYSTHTFSIAEMIELARTLNQLPPRLIVYGVEGKSFKMGTKLSSEVNRAVGMVVECVLAEFH